MWNEGHSAQWNHGAVWEVNVLDRLPVSRTFERVIQLEMNEISFPVVQHLVDRGELPNFRSVLNGWTRYETVSESKYEWLEPWIQWVTAHTGKAFEEHGIFHLSDAPNLKYPQVWEELSERGVESLILGSMNATRGSALGGVFFPDPWAKQNDAHPASLKPVWDMISKKVQGHATQPLTLRDALAGCSAAVRLGVPPLLFARIATQVIRQKVDPKAAWRLAALFDEFLASLFVKLLEANRNCRYATLFVNAVAHYQHHYWRHFDPGAFTAGVLAPDCGANDDPMLFGYRTYDRILGQVLKSVDLSRTLVVIASGLSQVPFIEKDSEGGMNYYRLRDHRGFASSLGIDPDSVFPLMSRDWQLGCAGAADRAYLRFVLESLFVGNEPVFKVSDEGEGLFVETGVTRLVGPDEVVFGPEGRSYGAFSQHFSRIAIKSGHHTGIGCLFLSEPPQAPSGRQPVRLGALHSLPGDALGLSPPNAAPRRSLAS